MKTSPLSLRTLKTGVFGLAATIASAACGDRPGDNLDTTEPLGAAKTALASYDSAVLWTATAGVIPVCWMTPGWTLEKSWAEDSVQREWGRATNVSFVGWEDCPTSGAARYVKLLIDPHAKAASADGQTLGPGGTALLHGPSDGYSVHFWLSSDHAVYRGRAEYVAVHEFGHVLGFIHDQDRPDAPAPGSPNYCDNSIEQVPVSYATEYDQDSIMNYCNKYGNNEGILSALDVVGVQKLYGRKPNGSLVGDGGLCANIWGGGGVSGTTIASFRCTGASNDTWALSSHGGWTTFTSPLNRCALSATRPPRSPFGILSGVGTPVVADACSGSLVLGSVSWSLTRPRLIGYGNKCLDTSAGPYSQVVMRECNGSSSQQWTYAGGRFLNGDTSRGQQCLDLVRAEDVTGAGIASWECTGATNQLWQLERGGFIHPSGSSRVLDVYQAGTADGTPVYLWEKKASDTLNQQWFVRTGLASSLNGLALDVAGPKSAAEGHTYDVWTAHGGPNQEFDFYP